jgi:hypothetical protein
LPVTCKRAPMAEPRCWIALRALNSWRLMLRGHRRVASMEESVLSGCH